MTIYHTFKRAARSLEEFSRARKIEVERGLTYDEARERCYLFNTNRSQAQINAGLKMEFEKEGD